MPAGRPPKYDPAFCAKVEELGEQGASIVEMAYECGVTRDTLSNWASVHEEFLEAFTRAKIASQVWWERKGRSGVEKSAQEFQGNLWSRNMSARFPDDWRERKEIDNKSSDGSMTPKGLDVSNLSTEALQEIVNAKRVADGK